MNKFFYKSVDYRYQLVERVYFQTSIRLDHDIVTEYVTLLKNGVMILEKGYAWNGPSFPAVHTDRSIIASLPHDSGYQLITLGLLPKKYRINLDWLLGSLVAQPAVGKSIFIMLLNKWRRIRGSYYFFVADLFGYRYTHQVERSVVVA